MRGRGFPYLAGTQTINPPALLITGVSYQKAGSELGHLEIEIRTESVGFEQYPDPPVQSPQNRGNK